ncbi:MAG: SUMF1/EgtB/PvdO family nonheme iron enzyme [Spirochaetaceae bacterium]|nr:SUMF1/EgtB/PvdO family nonheme iron enzyme [Spirochaetaceae bacterium]
MAGKTVHTVYTVSIETPENGAIAARPSSGYAGSEIILMVSPRPGYRLQKGSLKYHGDGGDAAIDEILRTFRLPARNVTISALFEPLPAENFSISVKIDDLDHGVIVAQPEFGVPGTPVYLAVIPDPGYRYKSGSLKYNDMPVDEFTRTFLLPDKHVLVTAKFESLHDGMDYTVRIGVTQNGRIFARPEFSPAGAEVYLQVNSDPGYILKEKSLKYSSSAGELAINERRRTFIMPADHVMVAAEFVPVPAPDDYTVSIGNILNGRIIPDPGYGKEKTPVYLHVIPDPGYVLVPNSLKIKGPSVDQQVNEISQNFEMPPEHVTARAEFKPLPPGQYTVRTDMTDHGRILAVPAYGGERTVISLQLYPDFGYRLKTNTLRYSGGSGWSVSIDEVARTFFLPADHVTVQAEFEKLPPGNYMIFSDVTANGHISPAPESGPKGTEIFLWITPDAGYKYKPGTLNFRIDKNSPATSVSDTTRTFKLPESPVLVGAEFEPVSGAAYTIRINPASHGRISVNTDTATAGETITLTINPDPKYGLKKGSLKYAGNDGAITPISETFTMPGKHITILGEFESVEHRVRIDKNLNGGQISVNPEKAYPGETITLTVMPINGNSYEAKSLKYLDTAGQEKNIDPQTLQFAMPNDDVTVTAKFMPFTAIQDLKINNRPMAGMADGKTDYTFWLPSQEAEAVFTFSIAANAEAEPKSGTKHTVQFFENAPVQYTVKDPDGITKTTYTFRIIRELVPAETVPAGRFLLEGGNPMEITRPFSIGKYELTQEEWRRVTGYNRGTEGNDFPANGVTWYEAVIFCNKLSMLEKKTPVYSLNNQTNPDSWGKAPSKNGDRQWNITVNWNANGYRLPTEMEWLWAAMGAANGQSGLNTGGYKYSYAGYPAVNNMDYAVWYFKTSGNACQRKGTKKPNQLGLFDMSGNIAEWCWDWYDGKSGYGGIPGGRDYTGPSGGSFRVLRGGYYGSAAWTIFLSFRGDSMVTPNEYPYKGPREAGLRILCRD